MPRTFACFTAFAAVGLAATLALAMPVPGPANKVRPPEDGPRGLKAEIVATKDTYALDPAQSGKKFADSLKNLRGQPPATPKIQMLLRISNPTQNPITIVVGGDQSTITLDLKGPGAVTIEPPMAMTMDYRAGKTVKIDAGKTFDIPLTDLTAGQRNMTQYSYWTQAGDYTLAATFVCHDDQGAGTKVSTEPAKLKITQ